MCICATLPLSPCPSCAWRFQCPCGSPSSPWLVQEPCLWGGHARSPRNQAVPGSMHCVRGPCRTDGPIVWCVGSPARGGTRAELGATVAGAGAEPDPVTPSWRQRWTWPSGAASARLSGSCSGRSWSGTRRRWHPSASAPSAAATGRTTRRTGRGESGVEPGAWVLLSPHLCPRGWWL